MVTAFTTDSATYLAVCQITLSFVYLPHTVVMHTCLHHSPMMSHHTCLAHSPVTSHHTCLPHIATGHLTDWPLCTAVVLLKGCATGKLSVDVWQDLLECVGAVASDETHTLADDHLQANHVQSLSSSQVGELNAALWLVVIKSGVNSKVRCVNETAN